MSKLLQETLQKLQEGAADNNATVMLEGERFRVRDKDEWSCLYELDPNGGSLRLIERTNAQGTPQPIKDGGEASSIEAAIKEMEEGPKQRCTEEQKAADEAEKKAEQERGGPRDPGLHTAAGVDGNGNGRASNPPARPQAHPTERDTSPRHHR